MGMQVVTSHYFGLTFKHYSQDDPPECTACQEIYSVRHVLIDCIDLGLIRPRFHTVPDLKTLFDTDSVDRIVSFVKEVNLFDKI